MSTGSGSNQARVQRKRAITGAEGGALERPLRSVGKYRILSELGRGGMANVFLAVAQGQGGVNKLVVLKALLPELSAQPDALAMFLDEARLAARLNHPNVVQTYEVGTEGDRHVIVMEYLEGQSLSNVLKRVELAGQKLSLAMHLQVISNALDGLHYAHELCDYDGSWLALVHRDVSPQNIFVTYDGQVKVLDFGIAKAATSSTNTATGVIKGKIAYMAPEQMIGDQVDRRADLYSIGCMLWAAATGDRLWKDTPDVHIMRQVINGETPSPKSVNASCDDELNRIVMKAMASSCEQRYGTALELQADLERYSEAFSSAIKPKEIGAYVSTLFADTRAELKAVVERRLALVVEANGPEDMSSSGARSHVVAAGDGELEQEPSPDWAEPRPARRAWLLLAAAIAAAAVLLGLSFYAFRPVTPGPVAPTAALPLPPAPAVPERTAVRIHALPADARLFLDEEPLASNPISVSLALDGSPRHVRAEADGYETGETTFVATRDRHIELVLKQLAPAASAAPGTRKVRSGPAASKVAAKVPSDVSGAKSTCDQPFFVDGDGIRKLRPECM